MICCPGPRSVPNVPLATLENICSFLVKWVSWGPVAIMKVAMCSVTSVRVRSVAIDGGFRVLRPGTVINRGATILPVYGSYIRNVHHGDATGKRYGNVNRTLLGTLIRTGRVGGGRGQSQGAVPTEHGSGRPLGRPDACLQD